MGCPSRPLSLGDFLVKYKGYKFMTEKQKMWAGRALAILPLLIGAWFITFSEKDIYTAVENSVPESYRSAFASTTIPMEQSLKDYPFRLGLDLSSGVRLTYIADTSKVPKSEIKDSLNVLRDVIERRVNAYGVTEPLVQIESSYLSKENKMLVELPGLTNVDQALQLIGQTPTLEFVLERDASSTEALMIAAAKAKYQADLASGKTPELNPLLFQDENFKQIGLDGRYLKNAQLVFDGTTGKPQVSIEWDETGKKLFATSTANNIGKRIGIILDGTMISAPTIQSAITDGKAVITGIGDTNEAKLLATRLKTGALPVPINIAGSEVIQPLLGEKALNAGILASLYGFLAIAILMIVWYRVPGVFGVISLITYAVVVLSIFKLLPVTLSAAAIAGFIISMGLAIDGNILIFERLKEELNKGKNLKEALEEGFDRAWTSVRDSHTASIIVSVILYFIGTSVVQGFALTLFIGVVVSLFTNVFVTRVLLRMVVPKHPTAKTNFFWKSLL
jgi:preprotein translocase subunit SecD